MFASFWALCHSALASAKRFIISAGRTSLGMETHSSFPVALPEADWLLKRSSSTIIGFWNAKGLEGVGVGDEGSR